MVYDKQRALGKCTYYTSVEVGCHVNNSEVGNFFSPPQLLNPLIELTSKEKLRNLHLMEAEDKAAVDLKLVPSKNICNKYVENLKILLLKCMYFYIDT